MKLLPKLLGLILALAFLPSGKASSLPTLILSSGSTSRVIFDDTFITQPGVTALSLKYLPAYAAAYELNRDGETTQFLLTKDGETRVYFEGSIEGIKVNVISDAVYVSPTLWSHLHIAQGIGTVTLRTSATDFEITGNSPLYAALWGATDTPANAEFGADPDNAPFSTRFPPGTIFDHAYGWYCHNPTPGFSGHPFAMYESVTVSQTKPDHVAGTYGPYLNAFVHVPEPLFTLKFLAISATLLLLIREHNRNTNRLTLVPAQRRKTSN